MIGIPSGYVDSRVILRKRQPEGSERAKLLKMLKRARADAIMRDRRIQELQAEIDTAEADLENAAAEHVEACAPLQERLEQLDAQRREALTNRQEPSEAIERERRDTLNRLDELNRGLDQTIAAARERVARLTRERTAVVTEPGAVAAAHVDGRIVREASSQDAIDEIFVCGCETFFQQQRRDLAKQLREAYTDEADRAKRRGDDAAESAYREAARKFATELAAAESAIQECRNRIATIESEILSE